MRRPLTILSLLVVALATTATAAVAGGGGGGDAACLGFTDGAEVVLDDNCFEGVGHEAPAGTVLTVRNRGQLPHTYTAVDGSFDTGLLDPGAVAELEDLPAGVHAVRCTLHSSVDGDGMAGLLVVAGDEEVELAASDAGTASNGGLVWWLLAVVASSGAGALLARRLTRSRP